MPAARSWRRSSKARVWADRPGCSRTAGSRAPPAAAPEDAAPGGRARGAPDARRSGTVALETATGPVIGVSRSVSPTAQAGHLRRRPGRGGAGAARQDARATTRSSPTAARRCSTRERFPDADELILAWPEEAFERIGLDAACYVCVLTRTIPSSTSPRCDSRCGRRRRTSARSDRRRRRPLDESDCAARGSAPRRSPGCTARSDSSSAAGSRRRSRSRSWRR